MGAILSISSPNNIFEWMAFLAEKYSSMFLQGTWITLYVSVIGTIVGFILGYIVGIVGDIKIHKEDNPIKKGIIKFFKFICFLYVELFRGTPMIVQAMIVSPSGRCEHQPDHCRYSRNCIKYRCVYVRNRTCRYQIH